MVTLVFLAAPQIDLIVSDQFHLGERGFAFSRSSLLQALRGSSTWVLGVILLGVIGALIAAALRGGWRGLTAARRSWCVLLTLVLGPGLLINMTLKTFWGRPRPVHVDLFGGDAPYVPVWTITDWCASNCSFASGEGASAAWMAVAAACLPPPWRAALLAPALIYGAALSLNRVVFGGHFLSDVLMSWTLTAVVGAGVYALLALTSSGRVFSVRPLAAAA